MVRDQKKFGNRCRRRLHASIRPDACNIIIIIFYYGLMVHITDTRSQKVVSYTSSHFTETVFAHDQHWEEQSSLSSPQLYRHSQKHRKWITIQSRITQPVLVRVQPWEEQNTFPELLTLHSVHIFYYTNAILMRRKYRHNSRTTTAFGLHHTGASNNWGKMKICKKHQTFEAIE